MSRQTEFEEEALARIDYLECEKQALQLQVIEISQFIEQMRESFLEAERIKQSSKIILERANQECKKLARENEKLQTDYQFLMQKTDSGLNINQLLQAYQQNSELQQKFDERNSENNKLKDQIYQARAAQEESEKQLKQQIQNGILLQDKLQKRQQGMDELFQKIDLVVNQNIDLRKLSQELAEEIYRLNTALAQQQEESLVSKLEAFYQQFICESISSNNVKTNCWQSVLLLLNKVMYIDEYIQNKAVYDSLRQYIQFSVLKDTFQAFLDHKQQFASLQLKLKSFMKTQNKQVDKEKNLVMQPVTDCLEAQLISEYITHFEYLAIEQLLQSNDLSILADAERVLREYLAQPGLFEEIYEKIQKLLARCKTKVVYPEEIFLDFQAENCAFVDKLKRSGIKPNHFVEETCEYLQAFTDADIDAEGLRLIGDYEGAFIEHWQKRTRFSGDFVLNLLLSKLEKQDVAALRSQNADLLKQTEELKEAAKILEAENVQMQLKLQRSELQMKSRQHAKQLVSGATLSAEQVEVAIASMKTAEDQQIIFDFEMVIQQMNCVERRPPIPQFAAKHVLLPIGPTPADYYAQRLAALQ